MVQRGNRAIGFADHEQYLGSIELCVRIRVGAMTTVLQTREGVGKVSDVRGKTEPRASDRLGVADAHRGWRDGGPS